MTGSPNRLTLGILASTRKPDERRLPIHPLHLDRITPEIREQLILEEGYGERFGVSDEHLASLVGRIAPRRQLLADADVVLLPKPQPEDLAELRVGQVLWG
ncbi:MAG: alanine dehydrogenase, partial [Arthrobacter sp.]